jgi:hypothetical protein
LPWLYHFAFTFGLSIDHVLGLDFCFGFLLWLSFLVLIVLLYVAHAYALTFALSLAFTSV